VIGGDDGVIEFAEVNCNTGVLKIIGEIKTPEEYSISKLIRIDKEHIICQTPRQNLYLVHVPTMTLLATYVVPPYTAPESSYAEDVRIKDCIIMNAYS
jgi:hypothetical protein